MTANSKKKQVREQVLDVRKGLAPDFRRKADCLICENLLKLPELHKCPIAAAYVSDGTEPDLKVFIESYIASKRRIFLPRSKSGPDGLDYELAEITAFDHDLVRGAYGILEPGKHCPAAKKDEIESLSWLVPGVAFDDQGQRLGRGKGFYDRLLNRGTGIKIGIFYECQKVTAVPVETHDQSLDLVVTEKHLYRINNF